MKTALKTAMATSISDVLETMFFMFLDFGDNASIESDVVGDSDKVLACKINFKGEFSGHFIFLVPENILLEMTENFMGLDGGDISKDEIEGTIKEAINMLAGATLSSFDSSLVFNLSIPELVDANDAAASVKETEDEIVVVTNTAEGHIALKAIIESG